MLNHIAFDTTKCPEKFAFIYFILKLALLLLQQYLIVGLHLVQLLLIEIMSIRCLVGSFVCLS
jgi:hypothetical protein